MSSKHRHSILESAFFKVVHCHLCCNIVIQLSLDSLEKPAFQPYAYRFSSVQDCSLLSSAYADDVELVTCLQGSKNPGA